jgi:DNA helicase-2/ATP-dependent DNA helicase PcrA
MAVSHERFGTGTVLGVEGKMPDTRIIVEFPSGKKQLLLRFAKLKIVT